MTVSGSETVEVFSNTDVRKNVRWFSSPKKCNTLLFFVVLLVYFQRFINVEDDMSKLQYSVSGKVIFLLFTIFLVSFFFSCKTAPKEKPVDPNFLGDYAPIQFENLMGVSYNAKKIKPLEIKAFFVPRMNTVELYFRLGINSMALVLDQETRETLLDSIYAYLEDYQEERFLPNYIPTKENVYKNGKLSISWGLLSPGYTASDSPFRTNYKNLDAKPYFYIYIQPSPDDKKENYSPKTEFYFSPSQLEALVEVLEQENLQAYIDELDTKAYGF